MSHLLSYDQLAEAKHLFEAYQRHGEYHDSDKEVDRFLSWIDDYFPRLLDWANQEPMAHQLADADQALSELETLLDAHPMEGLAPVTVSSQDLRPLLARIRAAIDGKDYQHG